MTGSAVEVAVLYTPFRRVLGRYASAVRAIGDHTLPEFLEEPTPEHAALLELLSATRRRMRTLRRHFPAEPPDGFGPNGPDFGPVLHPDDMRVAVSVLLPLALTLGGDFPTESYGPESFLRVKCVVLATAIEVYAGWEAYAPGRQSRTKWEGFPPQVPPDAFPDVELVVSDGRHLTRLFENVSASAGRCQDAVSFQLRSSGDGA